MRHTGFVSLSQPVGRGRSSLGWRSSVLVFPRSRMGGRPGLFPRRFRLRCLLRSGCIRGCFSGRMRTERHSIELRTRSVSTGPILRNWTRTWSWRLCVGFGCDRAPGDPVTPMEPLSEQVAGLAPGVETRGRRRSRTTHLRHERGLQVMRAAFGSWAWAYRWAPRQQHRAARRGSVAARRPERERAIKCSVAGWTRSGRSRGRR